MDTNYTYVKSRREFGKQCRFSNVGPTVLYNLMPDPSQEEQWLLRNPIDKNTQEGIEWSEHEVSRILKCLEMYLLFHENFNFDKKLKNTTF